MLQAQIGVTVLLFFQKPDGKLVWEKLPRDVFAFRFTVLLCAGGMALLANTYYKMAYGIKPES